MATKRKVICPCGKGFKSEIDRAAHLQDSPRHKNSCCGQNFMTSKELSDHMKSTAQHNTCCGRSFKSAQALADHMKNTPKHLTPSKGNGNQEPKSLEVKTVPVNRTPAIMAGFVAASSSSTSSVKPQAVAKVEVPTLTKNDLTKELKNLKSEIKNEVASGLKDEFGEFLKEFTRDFVTEIKVDITADLKKQLKKLKYSTIYGIKRDLMEDFQADVEQELRRELRDELLPKIRDEIRNDIAAEVRAEILNEFLAAEIRHMAKPISKSRPTWREREERKAYLDRADEVAVRWVEEKSKNEPKTEEKKAKAQEPLVENEGIGSTDPKLTAEDEGTEFTESKSKKSKAPKPTIEKAATASKSSNPTISHEYKDREGYELCSEDCEWCGQCQERATVRAPPKSKKKGKGRAIDASSIVEDLSDNKAMYLENLDYGLCDKDCGWCGHCMDGVLIL